MVKEREEFSDIHRKINQSNEHMDLLNYDEDRSLFPQIYATGVSEALYKVLWVLKRQEEQPSRDGTTKEAMNTRFVITEPRDRYIRLEGRKHNVFSQIGETLWVLSGSSKLSVLSMFLPRAEQFSDDGGKTWRSAYGKRLRAYPAEQQVLVKRDEFADEVDQLEQVVEKLALSPETRRAFVVLTYPPVDHYPGIDVVCNVALHFLIRNGKLHMSIHNRSNDAIWGFSGINFFEFTVLQEVLVSILNNEYNLDIEVGSYVHNSMSFHIYSRHYERMEGILDNNGIIAPFLPEHHFPFEVSALSEMDNTLGYWTDAVLHFSNKKSDGESFTDKELGEFIQEFMENTPREGTLNVYAGATLLYLAKKHGLLEGELIASFEVWYGYFEDACRVHNVKPKETHFFKQIEKKLTD